ncbi:MAG: hypothetical protein GX589_07305 [Deltaproteobacteria bacterium]|nr:hypothetical protein [Deltaproteobacteria bacterium]
MKLDRFSAGFLLLVLVSMANAACTVSNKEAEWQQPKKQKVFKIATRQLPPEPVYGALRWVRPPQVLPEREIPTSSAPLLMPVIQFEVKDKPLSEVALILAATAGYRSYCAGSIASQKLTLVSLGTLEELGREIEEQAEIEVLINHRYKEVRFLAKDLVSPKI